MQILISIFRRHLLALLLVLFLPASALSDSFSEQFRINTFYTLDATVSDANTQLLSNAGVLRTYLKGEPSFKNTLLGSQAAYQVNDSLSVVVQGKLFIDQKEDFTGNIDWAYLSFDTGNDLTVRAGKLLIPFMKGTETRNIGFSRLWARPLIPRAGVGGYEYYLGLEGVKRFTSDSSHWLLQVAAGQAEHDLIEVDNQYVGLVSVQYGWERLWIRGSLLNAGYDVFTPRKDLVEADAQSTMVSVEAEYDFNSLIIQAGYSGANADITPNDSLYYLSLGKSFGSVTPFIFGAKRLQHYDAFELPVRENPGGREGPPPPSPPDGDVSAYSYAAGFRWDINEQHALKFQIEHTKFRNKAIAAPTGPELGVIDGSAATLVLEGVF